MRVGFLFNHYAFHHILHGAPIAFALSARPGVTVEIVLASAAMKAVVDRLAQRYPKQSCTVRVASVPRWVRAIDPLVRRYVFLRKEAVLRANKALFSGFDVLAVPEMTSVKLRRLKDLAGVKLVYTAHGAGDRAVGFDPRLTAFDLALAAGDNIRRRFLETGVAPERCAVVGYPKFSVAGALGTPPAFDEPAKPTVLYNPHFDRQLGSWARWGPAVLDLFHQRRSHNLIFAPHVVLYQRPWRHRARPLGRWRGADNMALDTGSLASIDMTYTQAADIYLGDVSSQVYEFLKTPRPCVFLNAEGVRDWQADPNYRFWHAGEVVDDIADLPAALARAPARHKSFRPVQERLFKENFELTDRPSEERAADAIQAQFGT